MDNSGSAFFNHLNSIEVLLISSGKLAKELRHPVHKGAAREFFIRNFLQDHIAENVSIGTGELLDINSRLENQFDVILYRKDYPKLYAGGINTFLIESVISILEIKSNLTKADLNQTLKIAKSVKMMQKSRILHSFSGPIRNGVIPLPLAYIVAYSSSMKIETILNLLRNEFTNGKPTIDGIFILGKGLVYFDHWQGDPSFNIISDTINSDWKFKEAKLGILSIFFYNILQAMNLKITESLDVLKYYSKEIQEDETIQKSAVSKKKKSKFKIQDPAV